LISTTISRERFPEISTGGAIFVSPFDLILLLFATCEPPKGESERCAELITSHLKFLDGLCEKKVTENFSPPRFAAIDGYSVVSSPDGSIPENAKEELLGVVLDHLRADDFKVVRAFKGKSKFTTFLASVLSNLAIDMFRIKEGRSRAGDRAEEMDDLGKKVYELVYEKRYSAREAQSCLEIEYGIRVGIDRIHECLERMRGRGRKDGSILMGESGHIVISSEGADGMEGELVVPDFASSPEALYAERERSKLAGEVVSEFLKTLSGEEKIIFRMRFPPDEKEEPKSFREIGEFLGISEDKAGRVVAGTLKEFREKLMSRGISPHDLI
jgi:RNA polymerase sigma factor (sigma-70 family)